MLRTFTLSAIIKAKVISYCFRSSPGPLARGLFNVENGSVGCCGTTIKRLRERRPSHRRREDGGAEPVRGSDHTDGRVEAYGRARLVMVACVLTGWRVCRV